MKTFRFLILMGFAVGMIAVGWQARTIAKLRAEVATLRSDLLVALASGLDDATGLPPDVAQVRREKLERIKLRHQMRELNENLAASHGLVPKRGFREALKVLLPTPAAGAPWKLRAEWNRMEALATNQYAQAMTTLAVATNEYDRYLALDRAAKMSLAVGRSEDARQFATDMMVLAKSGSKTSTLAESRISVPT